MSTGILDVVAEALALFDTDDVELAAEPASEDAVAAYETELGFALPEEVRELALSRVGGLFVVARDEVWPPAEFGDVGPFWTFLKGVSVLGLGDQTPAWASMRARLDEVRELGVHDFAPVLKVVSDPRMYGYTAAGKLVISEGLDELEETEFASFGELLRSELRDLAERIERMKAQTLSAEGRE